MLQCSFVRIGRKALTSISAKHFFFLSLILPPCIFAPAETNPSRLSALGANLQSILRVKHAATIDLLSSFRKRTFAFQPAFGADQQSALRSLLRRLGDFISTGIFPADTAAEDKSCKIKSTADDYCLAFLVRSRTTC